MADFSKLVITDKGQALIAKMIAGSGNINFTKMETSSTSYKISQLETLSALTNIKQTSPISKVIRTNEVAVRIETVFSNTELTEGYYMRTLGLYAVDPDIGEILYAVTTEITGNCYMPAYNGITVSGAYIKLITIVGNAENVSLEIDPGVYATVGEIKELKEQIDILETRGTDTDVIESAFYTVFTKMPENEEKAMTPEEIQEAINTAWNGEASPDPTAMTPEEINTAVSTAWNGETSLDPTALSSADIADVIN